ncbi:MAG: porin family protein [Gammaproteobacteria bacterium]|nr:porin family protein [Gammaproteobacteria bacterium]
MKFVVLATLSLVLSVSGFGETAEKEKTKGFKFPPTYSLIGLSWYGEDTKAQVGSGIGFRLRGFGMQFNDKFGVEGFLDIAAKLETSTLSDVSDVEISGEIVDLKTKRNNYASIVGTYTHQLSERWSLIGKAGYSRYSKKFHVFFEGDQVFPRRLVKESDFDSVVSFGLLRKIGSDKEQKQEKYYTRALELSLTKFFGEAGAMSINVRLRGI